MFILFVIGEIVIMVRAIVGANWGDEGKGKITDMFAQQADIVVRFQGGANAGHTIINEHGRFALHLMPSGVCSENTTCIIGNGVALDIDRFISELEDIKKAGLNPNLLVSERCQILMPYHVKLDEYEEERLGKAAFGSTKSGIAPFFSDKYAKIGIQVNELFDDETLKAKLKNICTLKNLILKYVYNKPLLDADELFEKCMEYKEKIAPFVCDTHTYIQNALKEGKEILLEGQLGTLKDPDFGIYPMVTSSPTLAGYGCVGAGIPANQIKDIVCVTKAYSCFVRRQDVHAVVRDAAGLLRRHLCGADVQPLIDLHGIAADDLAGKVPCQRHAESGFACGSGAHNGYDRMFTRCVQTAFPAPFGSISVRRGVRAGRRAAPRRKGSFRPAPTAPAARTYPPL